MKASAAADDVEQPHLTERKGLEEALSHLRAGDALVVWRLDRLGPSLRDLIDRVTRLNDRKVGFRSLTEQIDTTTSGGKLVFHIFGALAEFERDIIRERTNAGLAAARSRGKVGGRRRSLSQKDIALVKKLHADKGTAIADICRSFNISRRTLQRYVKGK
jgi:DNA invertase Pin-like site-specific DNA recombinase